MANATDKQIDGILRRANELNGTAYRYLSQVRDVIGLSSFQVQRGLTNPQASAIIRDLDARLEAKAKAEQQEADRSTRMAQAAEQLDALGADADEMRHMLVYLTGFDPVGMIGAIGMIRRLREQASTS